MASRIPRIAFAAALPAAALFYGLTVASFLLPAFGSYSGATYGESSAPIGRILKDGAQKAYSERTAGVTETFKAARERAKAEAPR